MKGTHLTIRAVNQITINTLLNVFSKEEGLPDFIVHILMYQLQVLDIQGHINKDRRVAWKQNVDHEESIAAAKTIARLIDWNYMARELWK